MNKALADLRKRIDDIDDQLVRLLVKRLGLAKEVRKLKKELDMTPEDPEREREIIDRLIESGGGILSRDQLTKIFRPIFNATKRVQQ